MSYEAVVNHIQEVNPEAILFHGYEDALIGQVERFNEAGNHILVALYDRPTCIGILMTRDGMTHEEAEEFFSYNTEGCYAGPHTPAFATLAGSF